jgi:hypothetical protein
MTDKIPLIETNTGKLAAKFAKANLLSKGVPLSSEEVPSVKDFYLAMVDISVPAAMAAKHVASTP